MVVKAVIVVTMVVVLYVLGCISLAWPTYTARPYSTRVRSLRRWHGGPAVQPHTSRVLKEGTDAG